MADDSTSTRQMTFSILDSGEVRADFGEALDPVTFNPATMPETLFPAALAEGFISRLRGYTSRLTGEDRTPENLRKAIAAGIEALTQGVWKIHREAGAGGEGATMEQEAAFVFRCKRAEAKGEPVGCTLAEAAIAFSALTEEQKSTLKALPRYQAALAEVKAKRATLKAAKLAKKAEADDDFNF